ncbi:hypothetical protein G6F68_018939 [Rhizopus microsporus]|nr:hypothetical protein G6F68_018939 [Rhizopus microsporus]
MAHSCEAKSFHWGGRTGCRFTAIVVKPTPCWQRASAVSLRKIRNGYRLLPEADARKARFGHVSDHRGTGLHQDRGEALSAGQYRPAAGHGQEDRLLADG